MKITAKCSLCGFMCEVDSNIPEPPVCPKCMCDMMVFNVKADMAEESKEQ